MRTSMKLPAVLAAMSLLLGGFGSRAAQAAEVLTNLGLEDSAGPAGWTLTQAITNEPGLPISAVEHLDAGNEPAPAEGELGLLLKSPAGNNSLYEGQDKGVDVTLTQTATGIVAGQTYAFVGHSFFQGAASGIVANLNAFTPLGDYNLDASVNAADYTIWQDTLGSTEDFRANGTNEGASLDLIDQADYDWWKDRFGNQGHGVIPSPTQSFFRVEFLNASDQVISTPVNIDLRSDPTTEAWRTHEVTGIIAPANATKARVTAITTEMRVACTNDCVGGQDVFWDNFSFRRTSLPVSERLTNGNLNALGAPNGWVITKTSQDNLSFAGDPSFAAHAGGVGMWLRSFAGGDAKISQTVPAVAGADYDYSAWSKWEQGYIDLDPLHPEVVTTMTLEYLDASSVAIGSPITLDLETVQMGDAMWRQFTVDGGAAPVGTAFVRISAGAINMGNSAINPQSAFFDDFSLIETIPGAASIAGVPEPNCVVLLAIALGMICVGRRGGR